MMKPVLLDQARAVRARAERTRRLARSIDDPDATRAILSYADELERRAAKLEAKACDLQADGERDLAREIHSELQTARANVSEIQRSLGAPGPKP
jgi:hypothetical protein